jgi:hypothetical protein
MFLSFIQSLVRIPLFHYGLTAFPIARNQKKRKYNPREIFFG